MVVEEIPGASRGSVGDHTKRTSITGPCRVGWRDGFRRVAEHFYPDRVRELTRHPSRRPRYPSASTLLAEATETTGLTDFGPGDFRDGLDVLLESLERDADLSPRDRRRRRRRPPPAPGEPARGRGVVRATIPRSTSSRCAGPIDINGLPRTGTTALANMLSLDPQFRCLRQWEQVAAVPAADDRGRGHRSASAAARPGERAAPARAEGDAPLRRRRDGRGHASCSAWRSTGSSTRCRCTATTRGGARPT